MYRIDSSLELCSHYFVVLLFFCLFVCFVLLLQGTHVLQSSRHANLSLLQRTVGKTHLRRRGVWKLRHAMRKQWYPTVKPDDSAPRTQPPFWICDEGISPTKGGREGKGKRSPSASPSTGFCTHPRLRPSPKSNMAAATFGGHFARANLLK